jgi:hypothetical protein
MLACSDGRKLTKIVELRTCSAEFDMVLPGWFLLAMGRWRAFFNCSRTVLVWSSGMDRWPPFIGMRKHISENFAPLGGADFGHELIDSSRGRYGSNGTTRTLLAGLELYERVFFGLSMCYRKVYRCGWRARRRLLDTVVCTGANWYGARSTRTKIPANN